MIFSCIFWFFSFFHSYRSFNHANSTFLSFSESPVLFLSILLLSQLIESHFALSSARCHFRHHHVSSPRILHVLSSLGILDVQLVSFHHASSWFLRVPVCSSSGLLLIGPEASHLATIRRWGKTELNQAL